MNEIVSEEIPSTRSERLNDYIAGVRRRVKAMDEGKSLFARTKDEWCAVARRVVNDTAVGTDADLRERALTYAAAIFLATDGE